MEHPEPNATSVTLTWDLADNEEKGIKIDDIMISISTINDTLKLKIAGDATNFTKDGLVFGNYEFEVRPLNDFSTEDKVHEMVEVTVEEKKVEPVELEDKDDKVKEEQDIKACKFSLEGSTWIHEISATSNGVYAVHRAQLICDKTPLHRPIFRLDPRL